MSTPHRRQAFPLLPHGWQLPSSVTVPALASASKSVPLSSLVSGNTVHSHGPSIFDPPIGNPGLAYEMSFIFSRIPSKGEKSEILLSWRFSHFKLVKPATGDISETWFQAKPKRFSPVNLARNDISDIPLPSRYSSVRFGKLASGARLASARSAPQIFTFSSCFKFDRGDISEKRLPHVKKPVKLISPASGAMSDTSFSVNDKYSNFVNRASGDRSDMLLWPTSKCTRFD